MMRFLQQVADATSHLPPLQTLIIFPTQRACQEYRHLLAGSKKKVDWIPAILPIKELAGKLHAPLPEDELRILLDLYSIYCCHFKDGDFQSFFSYGQQLLDDFNEIDRQLIPVNLLFEEIYDLKSLEARFSPDAEDYEYIRNFWSEFIRTPHTPLQDSFLRYWKQLPVLYSELNRLLKSRNKAYEGMSWRYIAENMEKQDFFDKFSKVVFAGFYALNKSEEAVMQVLQQQGKLMLFKDADKLYTQSKVHEAGMFFRKGLLSDPGIPWLEDHFSVPKDLYSVKGCPGRMAIARELASSVSATLGEYTNTNTENSLVVVLADESLLFPTLHFFNRLGIKVNPSMGFSLKFHPLLRLLQLIKDFRQFDVVADVENHALDYQRLQDICADPLLKRFISFPGASEMINNPEPPVPSELLQFIQDEILPLPSGISTEKMNVLKLMEVFRFQDDEWIQQVHIHFLQAIHQIYTVLEENETEITLQVWWHLFLDALDKVRIPFLSGADNGVPLVGFLETRLMDYEHVFIAPLNENTLPSSSVSSSLIPYSLRKAYHLPCKEEQDAVTAYHFYRLLQRAKKIHLFYNTDLNATGGGERSRYLFQLHHELIEKIPPVKTAYLQQEGHLLPETILPISVMKTDTVLRKLHEKYLVADNSAEKGGFSASALSAYIACSLRFYFDQLAYLRPENKTEGLHAGHFGNALHKSMELAYEGMDNVTASTYDGLFEKIPTLVSDAIGSVYEKPVTFGHDYLMKGVLTELVRRIIDFDKENTPFRIHGLEMKLATKLDLGSGMQVVVKGIIDRLDEKDGIYRILDYKTGQDRLPKKEKPEQFLTDPENKLTLQLMIYGLLVYEHLGIPDLQLLAGIFRMKEFDEEINWLNEGKPISSERLAIFKRGLTTLISEIFNPDIPFTQTTELKRCRYCDYKGLCSRQAV